MRYVIIHKDEITQEMLDQIVDQGVTAPEIIWKVEPPAGEPGGEDSGYRYITSEKNYVNSLKGYKKLIDTEFDQMVSDIQAGKFIFNKTDLVTQTKSQPFADKQVDGKKLFKRVHGSTLASNTTSDQNIDFLVPYTQAKITGLEVINADMGDRADFMVLDTSAGTISGIPNYKLNQFGFDVNLAEKFHKEESSYDADVILGMTLRVVFKAASATSKTVGFNFILHEMK